MTDGNQTGYETGVLSVVCWLLGHDWTPHGFARYECSRCGRDEPAWKFWKGLCHKEPFWKFWRRV